jgi:hypothetical protein
LLVVPLPSSPDALTPQHRTPPEIVRAQVKKYPAATAWASARTSVATVALFGRRFRSGREARVAVVQTTDFWDLDDLAHTGRVDSSRIRRVLAQGQMGSRPVVVGEIRFQDSAKIPLAEDDDVVEAFSSHGTDHKLAAAICLIKSRSVTDSSGSAAWKRERWSEGDGQSWEGKATREDEPATLDM